MSSLWASDGEFEEDVKEIRKSIRISEAKRVQREKETKRRTTMVMSEFSCKYELATPWEANTGAKLRERRLHRTVSWPGQSSQRQIRRRRRVRARLNL